MIDLPKDGATVRLHKLYKLVEFCASSGTIGCTTAQMLNEGIGYGNTAARIQEYLTVLGPKQLGLITRRADRYYVEGMNYIEWAELNGFRERVYWLKCKNTGCQASYGSKSIKCPGCDTPNPAILNEPGRHTHTIPITSIPQTEKPEVEVFGGRQAVALHWSMVRHDHGDCRAP